jgi:hypothetical protein
MATKAYDWKRYWVPRDGSFAFDSEGFLASPSDGGWSWQKAGVVGFDELAANPCLVLLGEPGIGKTFAFQSARRHTEKARPSASVLFRNLGTYGDESRLIEDVFESPEFAAWSAGGGELHVFLDSFDECLLRVDTVAALLADRLKRMGPVDGLFFRIASRTAEWRASLEEAMSQKWGQERMKVYELAPLTKRQVEIAAEANTHEASAFLQEVIEREVVSFAIKPLTLELLLRTWQTGGGRLPLTQREIYARGCLELCSESNPERDTPRLRHEFAAEHLLAVASQIAAVTVFCKRSATWIGTKPSHKLETDATRSELARGSVVVASHESNVSDKSVRETLDTGLFTARGPDRLGWAHQTYAEYLAARYVCEQRFTAKQILDLIVHPDDPDGGVVPQLQEVAAWIASDNKVVFQHLLDSEPELLLRSDIAVADCAVKSKLVEALLSAMGKSDFRPDWWALRKRYRKLKHPRLSAQIRAALLNRKLSSAIRVEATRMADACGLLSLLGLLKRLALDATEDQDLREASADIVSRLGNSPSRYALKPLAMGKCGLDRNDELRAAGLRACWPAAMTADELFSTLKEPSGLITSGYSHFLHSDLVEGLQPADLPRALRWVAEQPKSQIPADDFNWVVTGIIDRAIPHLDDARILGAFARAILACLRGHEYGRSFPGETLDREFEQHRELRLKIVEAMLPHFRDPCDDSLLITRSGYRFVRPEDLDWVLLRLGAANTAEEQKRLSYLASWIFHPADAKRIDSLVTASQTCPVLAGVFVHWLSPMVLGSEAATKAKSAFDQSQQWAAKAAQRRERHKLTPLPSEHICGLLYRVESGDLDAWWQICAWAELEDNGRPGSKFYHIDLHDLPGWEKATTETRGRLVTGAQRYIAARGAEPEVWFHWQNKIYGPAVAGVRALALLAKEAPAELEGLPKEVWIRWLPAILRLHPYDEADEFRLLASRAFQKAPQAAVEWMQRVVREENREGENLWILAKLPAEREATLDFALLGMVRKSRLKPQCAGQLLRWLLDRRVNGAVQVARQWVVRAPKSGPEAWREKAVYATRLLMEHGEARDWEKIRALITLDTTFGKSLLEGISYEYRQQTAPLLKLVSEFDIAALWEWMLREYPMAEDPPERRHSLSGNVTTRWAVADLQDGLLAHLSEMGTPASCNELLRLIKGYTQLPWLRGFLAQAMEQTRRNTWQAPAPAELLGLSENNGNRLVQNADQLLDVVCDSLDALQAKLHAETPAAPFLWNKDRPKDEEALSNWVKIGLQEALVERGIVVNREVQIHIGERTDIHVDAIAHPARSKNLEHIKVIIEVKGCWNREIRTAMQTQLVNRYLKGNDCRHGIYLVGWFLCNAWSKTDSRRKCLGFRHLEEIRNCMTKQARSLTSAASEIRAVVLDASLPQVRRH